MRILDRLIPTRHLSDAAFAGLWAAAASGDQATHPHLERCARCRTQYQAFCGWLDDLRVEATEEADLAFPAERLAAQQAQIVRRLEALDRPVRVIAFPKFARPIADRPSVAYRWVASAAAAGLIIGVALGQWVDPAHRFGGGDVPVLRESAGAAAPAREDGVALRTANLTLSDEALLSEVEAALAMTPSVEPLRAIDTLTPRSRDFLDAPR